MAQEAILTLGVKTNQAVSDLNNFNSKLNKVGKTIALKVSVPLLALEGIAIKTFSEMEKGLTNVTNLVSKGKGFSEFSAEMETAQEEAVELGFAIEDVNQSLFDTVSALGQGQIALDTYAEAQKLAKGGSAQLSETVDGLTSVINAYGRDTTKASDVSNAFFTAQKQGRTTVSDLASNIGKVAPIAKTADIGFKTLLATMSELTLGGLSTAEATTGLKATINAIINPSKEAGEELANLGIANSITKLKADGLILTLKKINKAYQEDNDILTKLIPAQEALVAVTALNDDSLSHLQETQQKINDDIENGTGLNEAYIESMNDLGNITQATIGALKTLANTFGELFVEGFEVKEFLKDMGEEIKDLKTFIQEMSPEQKKMTLWVVGLATVLPPLVVGVTGFVASIGAMAVAVQSAVPVLMTLGAPFIAITASIALGIIAANELFDLLHGAEQKAIALNIEKLKAEGKLLEVENARLMALEKADDEAWEKQKKQIDESFRLAEVNHKKLLKQKKELSEVEELESFLSISAVEQDKIDEAIFGKEGSGGGLQQGSRSQPQQLESAVLKGSIEAFKQENTVANKVQNKQLKELVKQSAELSTIADNQSQEQVANF